MPFNFISTALNWAGRQAYNILDATNDYAWYLFGPDTRTFMRYTNCTSPSLKCIRTAKHYLQGLKKARDEHDRCERENRIAAREQAIQEEKREQERNALNAVKARQLDELTERKFTINVVNYNTYIDNSTNNMFVYQDCPQVSEIAGVEPAAADRAIAAMNPLGLPSSESLNGGALFGFYAIIFFFILALLFSCFRKCLRSLFASPSKHDGNKKTVITIENGNDDEIDVHISPKRDTPKIQTNTEFLSNIASNPEDLEWLKKQLAARKEKQDV